MRGRGGRVSGKGSATALLIQGLPVAVESSCNSSLSARPTYHGVGLTPHGGAVKTQCWDLFPMPHQCLKVNAVALLLDFCACREPQALLVPSAGLRVSRALKCVHVSCWSSEN